MWTADPRGSGAGRTRQWFRSARELPAPPRATADTCTGKNYLRLPKLRTRLLWHRRRGSATKAPTGHDSASCSLSTRKSQTGPGAAIYGSAKPVGRPLSAVRGGSLCDSFGTQLDHLIVRSCGRLDRGMGAPAARASRELSIDRVASLPRTSRPDPTPKCNRPSTLSGVSSGDITKGLHAKASTGVDPAGIGGNSHAP